MALPLPDHLRASRHDPAAALSQEAGGFAEVPGGPGHLPCIGHDSPGPARLEGGTVRDQSPGEVPATIPHSWLLLFHSAPRAPSNRRIAHLTRSTSPLSSSVIPRTDNSISGVISIRVQVSIDDRERTTRSRARS